MCRHVTSPAALAALGLSLGTGAVATAVCAVVGIPLALVIARSSPRAAAVSLLDETDR